MKFRIVKEVGMNNPSKYASKDSFRGTTGVKVTIVKSNGCEYEEYDDSREELSEEYLMKLTKELLTKMIREELSFKEKDRRNVLKAKGKERTKDEDAELDDLEHK